MVYLQLVAGFVLLLVGGDGLVRGAVALARRMNVSPLAVGLTVVAFGTSVPELVTSLGASLVGSPGIAVGNVVGSNIANILLILGVAALIQPLATTRGALIRDGSVLALVTLATVAGAMYGSIGRTTGLLCVGGLVLYVMITYRSERRRADPSAEMHVAEASVATPGPAGLWLSVLMTGGGLGAIMLGARWLVSAAVAFAEAAGVPETVVGLTVVAVGTSLPELVTSIVAAARRQADVAFGNIVGSNIFNLLGILGVTAVVRPIDVPEEIARFDVWIMGGATVLLLVFSSSRFRLARGEAAVLLAGYVGYVWYLTASVA